jgi:L-ascorbate metabolism protein UlaG (beta-lactamase superfamily)
LNPAFRISRGEILKLAGLVCGVVFKHQSEKTLYIAGDTVWYVINWIPSKTVSFVKTSTFLNPAFRISVASSSFWETVDNIIKDVDAVIVTHLHYDHWDEAAKEVLPKDMVHLGMEGMHLSQLT